MKQINLTQKHKRLVSTLLFVLEQKIDTIEHILSQPDENASYFISKDVSQDETVRIRKNCLLLKKRISMIAKELNIPKRPISQGQYINTIQSHMWEHIMDAYSDKMHGYGKAIEQDAVHVDPFIQQLSELVDQLRLLQ